MSRMMALGAAGSKTLVCNACGRRKDRRNGFYATPSGTTRGRKCIKCVCRDRMSYHERMKGDPEYVERLRESSINYWYRKHSRNIAAQRVRDRRRRKAC